MTSKQIKLSTEQLELASKLTTLQRKFVIALVKPGANQTSAAKEAGCNCTTDESFASVGKTMFKKVQVRAFYNSLMESIASDSVMTRQEAVERLSKSARATIHDVCTFKLVEVVTKDLEGNDKVEFNTVWEMKCTEDIDPVVAAAIKSVTFTKNGPKIEMYDSNGSIKILSDMQGWNAPRKSEITGKDGQALAISADVSAPEIANALAGLMGKL